MNKELQKIDKDIASIKATDYTATTVEEYNNGADILKQLTAAEKRNKSLKDTVLKPQLEAIEKLRDIFRPTEEKLRACKDHVKAVMDKFLKEEEVRAEQERKRILADNRIKNPEILERKISAVVTAPTTNTRSVLVLKVTDMSKIPAEFFDLNESKLKSWLKEGNTCKGAELVKEKIIVS